MRVPADFVDVEQESDEQEFSDNGGETVLTRKKQRNATELISSDYDSEEVGMEYGSEESFQSLSGDDEINDE